MKTGAYLTKMSRLTTSEGNSPIYIKFKASTSRGFFITFSSMFPTSFIFCWVYHQYNRLEGGKNNSKNNLVAFSIAGTTVSTLLFLNICSLYPKMWNMNNTWLLGILFLGVLRGFYPFGFSQTLEDYHKLKKKRVTHLLVFAYLLITVMTSYLRINRIV